MFKLLEDSLRHGAQCADLYYLERNIDEIFFDNNSLKAITAKKLSGFNFRVKKSGKIGVVASSNFNTNDEILKLALEASNEGETLNYELNRPPILPNLQLTNDSLWHQSIEEYVADGEKIVQLIRDYDKEVTVGMQLYRSRETKSYLNTYGCEQHSSNDRLAIFVGGLLIQNQSILETGVIKLLNSNDYCPEEIAAKVIEKLKIGRIEQTLTSGKFPVILTPTAISQITYALAIGLSGENVRLGISPLKDRLGEQIISDQLTIIDDMTLQGGTESANFDDEGTPAERTILYNKGILQNYLLDLRSSAALGLKSNGKGVRRNMWSARDYANNPNPWFSNWIIQPGQTSFEDMIKDIKEGLIIDSMFGLVMGNLVRGDIDSDIDLAYKIENGQITGRVKNAAVGFNIYDLLKNQVVTVESKQHISCPDQVSYNLVPHILFKDVNIVL